MLGFTTLAGAPISSTGAEVPHAEIASLGPATYSVAASGLGTYRELIGSLGVAAYALTAADLATLNAVVGQLGPAAYTLTAADLAAGRSIPAALAAAAFVLTASDLATEIVTQPIPIRIGDVADADKYSPTWQMVSGRPKLLLLAGQNKVGVSPVPDDAYTLTLDVVRNAPIPSAGSDVLQVGQDVYEAILDIAQAVSLFKEGPQQNEVAQALLMRAASVAGIELNLQQGSQPSRRPLLQQTRVDEQSTSRELPLAEVE